MNSDYSSLNYTPEDRKVIEELIANSKKISKYELDEIMLDESLSMIDWDATDIDDKIDLLKQFIKYYKKCRKELKKGEKHGRK